MLKQNIALPHRPAPPTTSERAGRQLDPLMQSPELPVGALLASMKAFLSSSVEERIDRLIELRLRQRRRPTNLSTRLTWLVSEAVFDQPVLRNDMYRLLLEGTMSDGALATFLSEYHHASCSGFTAVVGEAAARCEEPCVRTYLRTIHEEEHTPRPHHRMLEDFIRSCEFELSEPTLARDFVAASLVGFTSSAPYALGYSLGVEIEADFQIALLATALLPRFEAEMAEDQWFNLHLGCDGEEFHSQLCVAAIAQTRHDETHWDELEAGFVTAGHDTTAFMNALAAKLRDPGFSYAGHLSVPPGDKTS